MRDRFLGAGNPPMTLPSADPILAEFSARLSVEISVEVTAEISAEFLVETSAIFGRNFTATGLMPPTKRV